MTSQYYSESQSELTPSQRRFSIKLSIIIVVLAIFMALFYAKGVEAVGSYPAVDPNMVLYYHFNNGTGENDTFVKDFSGLGNNATLVSSGHPVLSGSYLNDGFFAFNNSGYLRILDKDVFSPSVSGNKSTFSIWVYLNPDESGQGTTGRQYIISKSGTNMYEYSLSRTNSTQGKDVYLDILKLDGSSQENFKILDDYSFSTWYFITVVFNTTDVYGYSNGKLKVSGTLTKLNGNGNANISIGTRSTGVTSADGTLNGSVDEFIFYNKSLSSKEVQDLYESYRGCVVPYDLMQITEDVLLCNGTYYLNGSATGSIYITDHNINLFGNNTILIGNGSVNTYGIYSIKSNLSIYNLTLINYSYGINFVGSSNVIINNLTFRDNQIYSSRIRLCNNVSVFNSIFNHSNILISAGSDIEFSSSNNSYVYNNYIFNGLYNSIELESNSWTNFIYNNYIYSSYQNGIETYQNANNNTIYNNYIFNAGHNGINLRSFNNLLYNNTVNYSYHHGIDLYSCNINDLGSGYNLVFNNSINNVIESHGLYVCNSSNNLIYSNSFINQSGVNSTGVTFDTFSNNNSFYSNIIQGIYLTTLYVRNSSLNLFNFSFFGNSFLTGNSTNYLYGLNSALFSNGTSICNGSSSNLALNTGQVNITLRPNEGCYALDDYELVENTPRQYEPLWFSFSSPTEKRIASNLSQEVNTTVIINVGDCNNLMTLTYTTHSGDYSKTYNRAELDSMCSSNFVTLTNVEIEPATASNTISLTYQFDNVEIAGLCTRLVGGFSTAGEFIVIISLAIVAAFIIFTIQGRVDGKWLAGGIIGVALGAIAIIISSVLISGVC